jgi:hypothetical protein
MSPSYYAAAAYPQAVNPQTLYPQQSYQPVNYSAAAYQPTFTQAAYQQPVPWGQQTTAAMNPSPYPNQQPYPQNYANSSYANPNYAQSWFQMPSWLTGTGPLLSQNLMGQATSSGYSGNNSMMAMSYSAQPPGMNVPNYPAPTYNAMTAPVAASPGYYSNRDAMQAGLQPSVLR